MTVVPGPGSESTTREGSLGLTDPAPRRGYGMTLSRGGEWMQSVTDERDDVYWSEDLVDAVAPGSHGLEDGASHPDLSGRCGVARRGWVDQRWMRVGYARDMRWLPVNR